MNTQKISFSLEFKWTYLILLLLWSPFVLAQNVSENTTEQSLEEVEPIVILGGRGQAIEASMIPDASYMSVYVMIGKQFPESFDTVIPWLQTFFTHYELPVKFVQQKNPYDSTKCVIAIFINGASIPGHSKFGYYSLVSLRDHQKEFFPRFQKLYKEANGIID